MAKDLSVVNEIRQRAEADLETFIKLIHPGRILGSVHKEIINWITRQEAKSHQMLLLPRDHMKSALAAYWVAWQITKNPTIRVLYISSTANLAEKQLLFIKAILTSPTYFKYWPEMVNAEEGKREKWTSSEIAVDHPLRKIEAIRDPTVFTGGLTTSLTGLHCDIAVLDDVVVQENAYTEDGREKVRLQYSLLASIEGAEAKELVVGTRYHPKDLYNTLLDKEIELFDEELNEDDTEKLYEVFERKVEENGEFLWPRQRRADGKAFGFDERILAKKRAQYLDKTQFRAQYYNDPNDISNSVIKPENVKYYEREKIERVDGVWTIQGKRINIFAAIDFAFSKRKQADWTAIVVLGIDNTNNYYILEIDRFKTNLISEYFKHMLSLHTKWDFRKIRCEVSVAQEIIVKDLKENYVKPFGLSLNLEEFRPTAKLGNKEERIEATLQPRYANGQMFHYRGGNCELLEEELYLQNPPHDDIKDALTNAIEICIAPSRGMFNKENTTFQNEVFNNRFGGVSYRGI